MRRRAFSTLSIATAVVLMLSPTPSLTQTPPTVSANITNTDPPGICRIGNLHIDYTYPSGVPESYRQLSIYGMAQLGGHGWISWEGALSESGSLDIDNRDYGAQSCSSGCWSYEPNGSVTVRVFYDYWDGGWHTTEASTTTTIPQDNQCPAGPPSVGLKLKRNADGTFAADVPYSLSADCPAYGTVSLRSISTTSGTGQTYFTQTVNPGTAGLITQQLGAINTNMTFQARATACGTDTADAAIVCNGCNGPPTIVGSPIRLFDGVMEYTESDPLPTTLGLEFRRHYATGDSADTRFSTGWLSIFDTAVVPTSTPGMPDTVSVLMEDRTHTTFSQNNGQWVQTWPENDSPAVLTGAANTGFTFRDSTGTYIRTFDAAGHLTRIQDTKRGRAVSITYDATSNPLRISDENGNWAATLTVTNGHITQIAVEGRPDLTWTYTYTGSLLTAVTVAGATPAWRTYGYTNDRLATVTDATGTIIEQHDYDAVGRAITSLDVSGDITNITYGATDADGVSPTIVARPNNTQATYQQSFAGGSVVTQDLDGGCGSCGSQDATATYDQYGNLLRQQTGRGYITQRTYIANGRQLYSITTALVPAGCDPATDPAHCRRSSTQLATAALATTSASQTTIYGFGDVNWPAQPTVIQRTSAIASGTYASESMTYDASTGEALTHTVSGAVDTSGTMESHTTTTTLYAGEAAAFAPGGAFQSAWLTLPQPTGLKKLIDGPRTNAADITTFVYYPNHSSVPGIWRGKLAATRNAAGHITRYEEYDVFGHAAAVVDPNGVVTRSTYDALGRILTSTIAAVPGCDTTADALCATDLTVTRTYTATFGPLQSERPPNGNITSYTYDPRGRVLTITRGTSTADHERTTYTYDPATGKKASETLSAFENGSWVMKKTENFTYNGDGHLASVVHADTTAIHYEYLPDGTVASVQDENHTTPNTTYTYDPAGRVASVTQTLTTQPSGYVTTSYAHDLAGNPASVTDPNGNVTTYRYDDFGQLRQQMSPVSGSTMHTYDPGGNLLTTVDANGATTTRAYDTLSRVTSSNATRGTTTETVTWTYDTGTFGVGRVASMTDPTGSTSYAYERRGLLRSEVKTISGAAYTTMHAYDANGNRSRITYPSGLVAQYTFDWANRPATLTANGNTIVSGATYLPFGPLASVTFGNGTTRTLTYDTRYRVRRNLLIGPAGTIADYTYDEDNVGNIAQVHDAIAPAYNRDFSYDDLNRLTSANTGASLWGTGTYAYDAMGNLRNANLGTWKAATAAYVGSTPKLTSVTENGTTRPVTYDAAGNETGVGNSAFTYSPRNAMAQADFSAYAYDGRGLLTISSASVLGVTAPQSLRGGGSTGTGTVTLSNPALTDTTVTLSSDNTAANVPATAVVLAGGTSADFTITTAAVAADTLVTITATLNGRSASASVNVLAPRITAISVSPASAHAGDPVTATVTLDSPTAASTAVLVSGYIVGSPVIASVATGATTGSTTIVAQRLFDATTAIYPISATLNGATAQTNLTVTPPVLSVFAVNPSSVTGGSTSTAEATVTGSEAFMPQRGMNVGVTSSNPSLAGVYGAAIALPNSSVSGTADVLTAPVASSAAVVITGATGNVTQSASVTLQAAPVTIAAFTISPTSVVCSNPVTGTITLTAAAPAGGLDVEIEINSVDVVPRSPYVHFAPGATTATVTIDTKIVASSISATVSATHSVTTKTATITVTMPQKNYLTGLQPQSGTSVPNGIATTGGSLITTTATLAEAASGKTTITLSSSDTAVATVPSSLNVPSGATSANFTITTFSVTSPASATITGSFGGTVQRLIVSVLPPNAVTIASLSFPFLPTGPFNASGTITLTGPAPTGGAAISFSGGRPGFLDVVSSITIPAGATIASFGYTGNAFLGNRRTTDINATYMGITQSKRVSINPVTLTSDRALNRPVQCAAVILEPCITAAGLDVVTMAAGDPSRYYLYTPELQVLAETEQTTSSAKPIAWSYLWFGTMPVAQVDSASTIRWYATDHLGTPFLQTDSAGAVVWRGELTPYGEVFAYRAGAALHQPLRLPGQMAVDATELYNNIHRWYRSTWGRYTQVDPIGPGGLGIMQGQSYVHWPVPVNWKRQAGRLFDIAASSESNLYSYVGGNPLSHIDPRGLETIDCVVRRILRVPFYTKCEYVGFCIGRQTGTIYLAAGVVTTVGCRECAKWCTYHAESGYDPNPDDFECFPEMMINEWSSK